MDQRTLPNVSWSMGQYLNYASKYGSNIDFFARIMTSYPLIFYLHYCCNHVCPNLWIHFNFSAKHTGHRLSNLINKSGLTRRYYLIRYVFSSANNPGDSYKRTVQLQVFFQIRLILTCIGKLNIHDIHAAKLLKNRGFMSSYYVRIYNYVIVICTAHIHTLNLSLTGLITFLICSNCSIYI